MNNSDLTGFPHYHEGDGPFGGAKATREPLVVGNKSYADVTNDIAQHLERFPTKLWWLLFIPSFLLLLVFLAGLGATTSVGMGVVGLNSPRSEEHTSELQSRPHLVCRLLLEKK